MKSVLRNVSGQASGCTAQMTVRESLAEGSREPRSAPPALWLPPPPSSLVPLSSHFDSSLSLAPAAAGVSATKKHYATVEAQSQGNRLMSDWRSTETSRTHFSVFFFFFCCSWPECSQESLPCSGRARSAVSTLSWGKPPDSTLK